MMAPALGVLVFLLLFLPWGIGGYIQTIVGPLISVLAYQLLVWLFPKQLRQVALVGICCLAVIVCTYRVPTMLLRLHDLGKIVQLEKAQFSHGINMPCIEGSDSMRSFLKHKDVAVQYHASTPKDMTGLWLYDSAMCPLPGRVMDPPGCSQEFVYQSVWNKSYRLVRLSCDSAAG